ncbi:MAG: aldehyde dehydrogenase family protein [Saprospiraceae bacterium]
MRTNKYIKNFIDDALLPAANGKFLDNYNPTTGKIYSYFPASDTDDVQRAVEAAERAFSEWSSCGVKRRHRILLRLADIIEQNMSALARAESIDNGKPLTAVVSQDMERVHSDFRFFATAILHEGASAYPVEGEAINYHLRRPVGIVGCIMHNTLSLQDLTLRLAPALAMGNCVIVKASNYTPMTAHQLAKAAMKAGLPAGVLNIIHGTMEEAGMPIIQHPKVSAIAFTGDTRTGKEIAAVAAPLLKKLSLQLGGKNAAIVFADCDFNQMMIETLRSCFVNTGQSAHATSRILIERELYPTFKETFIKRCSYLKLGDPFASITDIGALISKEKQREIEQLVNVAKMEGGTLLCGGNIPEMDGEFKAGYFFRPTVVEGVTVTSRTNQDEITGPVVTIMPFDTEEEAIRLANDSRYGQSATLWTKDSSRAGRMAEQIRVGTTWVNCWQMRELRAEQGGIKQSGNGGVGGMAALQFFSEGHNVCLKY